MKVISIGPGPHGDCAAVGRVLDEVGTAVPGKSNGSEIQVRNDRECGMAEPACNSDSGERSIEMRIRQHAPKTGL